MGENEMIFNVIRYILPTWQQTVLYVSFKAHSRSKSDTAIEH